MAIKVSDQWSGRLDHYEPGDHVGVFAVNDRSLVERLIQRLSTNGINFPPVQGPIQLQLKRDEQQGPFN